MPFPLSQVNNITKNSYGFEVFDSSTESNNQSKTIPTLLGKHSFFDCRSNNNGTIREKANLLSLSTHQVALEFKRIFDSYNNYEVSGFKYKPKYLRVEEVRNGDFMISVLGEFEK